MFCISPVLTSKVAIARPKGQLSHFNHPPNIFCLFLRCPPSSRLQNIFFPCKHKYFPTFPTPSQHSFSFIKYFSFSLVDQIFALSKFSVPPIFYLEQSKILSRSCPLSTVQPIWLCLLAIDFKMVAINKSLASGLMFVLTFSYFLGGNKMNTV